MLEGSLSWLGLTARACDQSLEMAEVRAHQGVSLTEFAGFSLSYFCACFTQLNTSIQAHEVQAKSQLKVVRASSSRPTPALTLSHLFFRSV